MVQNSAFLEMFDSAGRTVPLQATALDHWPDGSVHWVLLDWQACWPASPSYLLRANPAASPQIFQGLTTVREAGGVTIDTGAAQFELFTGADFPFARIMTVAGDLECRCEIEDQFGKVVVPTAFHVHLETAGPLRAMVRLRGLALKGRTFLGLSALLHFFAGSPVVRFDITLSNRRRAVHADGFWNLGDSGSRYLADLSFTASISSGEGARRLRCSPEIGAPFAVAEVPFELYQDSSGGENWQSPAHLNRHHQIRSRFCGYRIRAGASEQMGRRATPVLLMERGPHVVAATMQHFWQNFPKAIEATEDAITLRLFPRQFADFHEIQGGEEKTHSFAVSFGRDGVTSEPLSWIRAPLLAHAEPSWYCTSGAVPYLVPRAADANTGYLKLVDAGIKGENTFNHKREVVDEYGWRHFGDLYADHEAVFHRGARPLVSHYNNQYDAVAGFACQFLRSGDRRWWDLMSELAAHVVDIDIYHTDMDRPAYNKGLFWHTYHYISADTATHRTYPRRADTASGGPSNMHNYTTGLMLHHFLTGNERSRQAVIDLAQWVIDMDDGRRSRWRWLARGPTGLASATGSTSYHGPGRGAANSINALLDAHQLTGKAEFFAKAEELVRRCIHPGDDIDSRHLLDAERRWSYTMFLQSLGRYLDRKRELASLDFMFAYARASLLHYARWMAEHEIPYLDKPELLEYPTETWAAQDLRKSEVFRLAALHAAGAYRQRFLERSEFFFRNSVATLTGMETRTLTRPVVLLLTNGLMHSYFQNHPEACLVDTPSEPEPDFGRPARFLTQRVRALRQACALALLAGCIIGLLYWLR
jgi:hypothetical protein